MRVNCAAIPSYLIASELFGHEKGAFTGALQRRLGRFEAAKGGTIFPRRNRRTSDGNCRSTLLRVLQERGIERVGSSQSIPVDVRIIAATNRDLAAEVAAGTFRRDMFYRLNVFPILMPALRERSDDIAPLVEHFVERYAERAGRRFNRIETNSLELLQGYPWPGNIRELQNVIERAVILSEGETFRVEPAFLQLETSRSLGSASNLAVGVADREREMIEAALAESRGRISGPSGAAARLGIPRQTLDSKIATLQISKVRFKVQSATAEPAYS